VLFSVSDTEEKRYFGFESGKKCEFEIEWGGLFHLKSNGAIVIPLFFAICGWVRTSFGDIGEKFT